MVEVKALVVFIIFVMVSAIVCGVALATRLSNTLKNNMGISLKEYLYIMSIDDLKMIFLPWIRNYYPEYIFMLKLFRMYILLSIIMIIFLSVGAAC